MLVWSWVLGIWNFSANAAFVYETQNEFLSSGDFNGDGIPDVLVLDKSTGNARIGYQNANGILTWSPSLFSGADFVSGCGVGKFLQPDRDTLAVTSQALNEIPLDDLSNTNSLANAYLVVPNGIGPHTLAALANPQTGQDSLFVASGFNTPPAERVEAVFFFPGPLLSYSGLFNETGSFERANAVPISTDAAQLAAGIARGTNGDALHIWQFTNQASILGTLSNLPPHSDYAVGTFDSEPLPRFWLYVPGDTNVTIRSLVTNGTGFDFTAGITLTFTQPVQRVFIVGTSNDGSAMIQFGDGIQGVRLPGGVPTFAPKYSTGGGAFGNVSGMVPLSDGQFVLLTGPTGTLSSASARVMSFDGANYTLISSNNLSPLITHGNRATVWLFQNEPFVSSTPGFIASVNAPDWSDYVSGLPGSLSARVESDAGISSGLSNPATNNFGAPPSGTAFGLPDQYRDDISLFTYTAPRPAETVDATISPAPGIYDGSITISFTKQHSFDTVLYRVDNTAWQTYASTFSLTHNATVQYYARSPGGSLAPRSPLHAATYTLGNTGEAPHDPIVLTNSVFTNPPPPINTNVLQIAAGGTVFYGRRNTNNNLGTIWAINLDGTGETYLTTGLRPRVSHDGHWMSFLRENDPATNQFSLWLRDLTTGTETRLHSSSNRYIGHDWEPDNATIIFDNDCAFWQIGLSGPATQLPLSSDCNQAAPALNPLDGRIAFQIIYPGNTGLYLAPSNATSKQNLNVNILSPRWPSWSADGQHIAVANDPNISPVIAAGHDLWVVDVANTNLHQITALGSTDGFPNGAIWKPDARGLVGAGTIGATNGLWIIPLALDGSACHCPPVLLPTSPGDPIDFAGSIAVAPQTTTVATPGLFIRTEPNAVVVYWNTNYDGFVLEYASDLTPPASWIQIDGPYFLNGGYYEFHEAKSELATKKFFRLRYPGILFLTPSEAELSFDVELNQAVITWPADYVGYTLESTTDLDPPAIWSPVTGNYGVTNGHFEFRQNLLSAKPREFFRLRWP